ncbi:hypothetical protein [Lentzea sp. NPDC092896]|uniref:hypothetical protein n=1 Tax=Lentzea sp. NPDC092896 TaxID=3364127 RepID=UPI003805DBAE
MPNLTAARLAEAFAKDYRERLGMTGGPLPFPVDDPTRKVSPRWRAGPAAR